MKLDLLIPIILCWYAALSRNFKGVCEKWLPPEHAQDGGQGTTEEQRIASSSQARLQTSQEGRSEGCDTASSHDAKDARSSTSVLTTEVPSAQDSSRARQLREQLEQENDLELTLKSNTGGCKQENMETPRVSNMADGERSGTEKSESIGNELEESSGQETVIQTAPQAADKAMLSMAPAGSGAGLQGASDGGLPLDVGGETPKPTSDGRPGGESGAWTGQEEKLLGSLRDLPGLHDPSTAPLTAALHSSSSDETVQNTEHQASAQSAASQETFDAATEQWEKTSVSSSVGSSDSGAQQADTSTVSKWAAGREKDSTITTGTASTVSVGDGETDGHKQAAEEDFLSFEEWRKKVLAQQEKEKMSSGDEDSLMSSSPSTSQKLRINFAAKSCGAKVVASNPEMENANYMLSANRDEYMLNPCSAKTWFVVELCEPVFAKAVELASLELFSSQPRSFRVSMGDRYPTKEWLAAGTFEMTDERVPQLFPLNVQAPYVKFVRVEMIDHYGSEHFCPVTLLRVFGLPIDEDIEEPAAQSEAEEEEIADGNGEAKNLFSRTKETVVNLVKKVLYKEDNLSNEQPERDGSVSDFVEVAESRGNISEDIMLPCEPDNKKERAGHHPIVDVHRLQPRAGTQQESAGLSASSMSSGDVPMVTKLGDEDQIENKRGSVGVPDGDQGMVTLIQSGSGIVWDAAHRHCHFQLSSDAVSCPYSSLCRYIQIIVGESPPFSCLRPPSVKLSSSLLPPHLPPLSAATSLSSSYFATTGLTETPGMLDSNSFSTLQGIEDSRTHTLTPSNVLVSVVESTYGVDETLSVAHKAQENTMKPVRQSEPRPQAVQSHSSEDKHQSDLVVMEMLTTSSSASRPVASDSWQAASEGHFTSKHPISDGRAHVMPARETEQQQDISSSPSDSSSVIIQAHPAHTAHSNEQRMEVLEPSIQLETTAVASPDELMRPTPVLEISRASMEGDRRDGEVRETSTPCVKPSPMSSLFDAGAGDEAASLYPQTLVPSAGVSQGVSASGATQTAEGDSGGSSGLTMSAQHNVTEKKVSDLDLVRIPLSISAKRETAIMRLTNRIKALELNVSLSSRFLDELSTRFKKQSDDLMKMLNKTISRLNTTTATSQQQNQAQEEKITLLETRLDNLTLIVQHLSDKLESFTEQTAHRQMLSLTFDFILLVILVMTLLRSAKPAPLHPDIRFLLDTMPRQPLPASSTRPRRNSDHGVTNHVAIEKVGLLKKGGSEANLVSMYKDQLPGSTLVPDDLQDYTVSRKKKRKKTKAPKTVSVDLPIGPTQCSQDQSPTTAAGVLFGLGAVALNTSGIYRDEADTRGSISNRRRWGSDGGSIAVIHTEDKRQVAHSDVTCSDPTLLTVADSSKPGIIHQSSPLTPTLLPLPQPAAAACRVPSGGLEGPGKKLRQVTCSSDLLENISSCICPTKVEILKYTTSYKMEDADKAGNSNPDNNSSQLESYEENLVCPSSAQSLTWPHHRPHFRMNENKLSFTPATQTCVSKGSMNNPRLKKETSAVSATNGVRSSETSNGSLSWYGSLGESRGGLADVRGRGRQEAVRPRGVSFAGGHLKKSSTDKVKS